MKRSTEREKVFIPPSIEEIHETGFLSRNDFNGHSGVPPSSPLRKGPKPNKTGGADGHVDGKMVQQVSKHLGGASPRQ
jgi:hypothetical protein